MWKKRPKKKPIIDVARSPRGKKKIEDLDIFQLEKISKKLPYHTAFKRAVNKRHERIDDFLQPIKDAIFLKHFKNTNKDLLFLVEGKIKDNKLLNADAKYLMDHKLFYSPYYKLYDLLKNEKRYLNAKRILGWPTKK